MLRVFFLWLLVLLPVFFLWLREVAVAFRPFLWLFLGRETAHGFAGV